MLCSWDYSSFDLWVLLMDWELLSKFWAIFSLSFDEINLMHGLLNAWMLLFLFFNNFKSIECVSIVLAKKLKHPVVKEFRLESLLLLGKDHLRLVLFQMVGEESDGSFGNSLALMNFFIFCAGGDLNLRWFNFCKLEWIGIKNKLFTWSIRIDHELKWVDIRINCLFQS